MKNTYKFLFGAMILAGSMAACTPEEFSGLSEKGLPQASEFESQVKVEADLRTNEITATYTGDETEDFFWKIVPAKGKEEILTEATWTKKYKNAGDYEVSFFVKNRNGLSDPIKTVVTLEKDMTGFYGFGADGENNIWKKANIEVLSTYYAHGDGWEGYEGGVGHTEGNNVYKVSLPYESNMQWQAQYHLGTGLDNSDVPADATYDMSCIISSNKNLTGMTIKLTDGNDAAAIVEERINLVGGEDYVFYVLDKPGIDLSAAPLKLVFDFGGNAPETEVVIENICIIDHSKNTELGKVPTDEPDAGIIWADVNSAANLMNSGALALASTWFANNDWAELGNQPTVEITGNDAKITVNEANGGLQWQGQVHLNTGVAIEEGKAYDFAIVLTPSQAISAATVKPHPEGDDQHFFSEGRHDINEYEDNRITCENFVADFSTSNLVITLDFPGCAAGTTIEVKNIIIQEHNEASAGNATDLMENGTLALASTWFANNDWAELGNQPAVEIMGNDAKITVNEANGGLQWQGQVHLNTSVAIAEGKTYDFLITLTPSQDIVGATVKPHPNGDDAHFFSEGRHDIASYEDNIVAYKRVVADFSTDNLVITLDFPSCAAGTTIEVTNIQILEY